MKLNLATVGEFIERQINDAILADKNKIKVTDIAYDKETGNISIAFESLPDWVKNRMPKSQAKEESEVK